MTTEQLQFLKREFENFIKTFEKRDYSDDFNLETPLLELEQIEQVYFNTNIVLNKLKNVIMPKVNIEHDAFSDSLEIVNNIKPIKIKYKGLDEKRTNIYKYVLTTISRNTALNCKIGTLPNLERSKCFEDLNLFDKREIEIVIKGKNRDMNEFKNLVLIEPNLEKRAFWIDLMPVNLNPIAPKFVKNISYCSDNRSLLLSTKDAFESLREAEIRPLDSFPCNYKIEETTTVSNHFQRKCIVNIDTLQNDLLIETLQSLKWQIYERPEFFKGIQMIQVGRSAVLFVIRIENIKRSIDMLKNAKNAKIIIELEDSK